MLFFVVHLSYFVNLTPFFLLYTFLYIHTHHTTQAGIVSAVGSDVDNFRVGDKVTALTGYGGFASEVRARAYDQVMPMPNKMSFAQASAFTMTYGFNTKSLLILI